MMKNRLFAKTSRLSKVLWRLCLLMQQLRQKKKTLRCTQKTVLFREQTM